MEQDRSGLDLLPSAIQKEIWEYVHGNRAFWREQFKTVIHDIRCVSTADRYIQIQAGFRLDYRAHTIRIQNVTNGDNASAKFTERKEMGFEVSRGSETCRKLTGRAWFLFKTEALAAFHRLSNH